MARARRKARGILRDMHKKNWWHWSRCDSWVGGSGSMAGPGIEHLTEEVGSRMELARDLDGSCIATLAVHTLRQKGGVVEAEYGKGGPKLGL